MKTTQAYPHQWQEVLTAVDLPDAGEFGPTAIRVRVHVTALNFYDLGVVAGRLPSIDGRIPMTDGAGVLEAVGSKVTEIKPGDHVVFIIFTCALTGWSHSATTTLTTAGVLAWRALVVNGGLKSGDGVLVLGTGGVSIFAPQIAQAVGVSVIATPSSDEKLKRLSTMGAAHVIDYRQNEN